MNETGNISFWVTQAHKDKCHISSICGYYCESSDICVWITHSGQEIISDYGKGAFKGGKIECNYMKC